MNNLLFSNSFDFNTFNLRNFHYTDNRCGCEYHYIAVLKKGTARIVHSGGALELDTGDCFYIPLNQSYRSYWYGSPEIEFDSYGFTYFPNSDEKSFSLQKINVDNAKSLLSKVETNQNHSCLNIGNFYTAFGALMQNMKIAYQSSHDEIISKATEYFQKNPACKIGEAAKFCGISESGLYGIFRESKGCTPNDIKQKILIERSITLLYSTDLTIEAIAEKCGFCSSIYFRKVFKKVTGNLPSKLRKSAKP